jgi:hypothetical protein
MVSEECGRMRGRVLAALSCALAMTGATAAHAAVTFDFAGKFLASNASGAYGPQFQALIGDTPIDWTAHLVFSSTPAYGNVFPLEDFTLTVGSQTFQGPVTSGDCYLNYFKPNSLGFQLISTYDAFPAIPGVETIEFGLGFYLQPPVPRPVTNPILISPQFLGGEFDVWAADSHGGQPDLIRYGANGQTTITSAQISGNYNDIPEPAAWALMILGFGLVGAAVRRRGARFA